jgi:hypothetical protein
MKPNKIATMLSIAAVMVVFGMPAWASMDDAHTIPLTPTKMHPSASGSTIIAGKSINVQTRGLKPDSVYTVWFVNMKPKKQETGAGTAPYMFKTDGYGNANYSAPLSSLPFGKWQMIMVVLHPDGNPQNMKKMVGALKAELKL